MVGLVDKNGNTVVSYTYDSWGKPLATTGSLASTLGADQPFRYRGYIYDNETGWYYLKSRYYNPSLGRFISADVLLSTGQGVLGHNAYAYCLNNPINRSDDAGSFSFSDIFSGAGLVSVGVTAILTAATILTCGAAAPLMVAVATVTVTAGAVTVVNGASEVVEGLTSTGENSNDGYNFMRDTVMGGNADAYEAQRDFFAGVAEVGTAICGSYYAANGGNVCFVAGTLVLTDDGQIPIEDIEVGDYVYATDPETGESGYKRVAQTFKRETDELVHVTYSGDDTITTTPTHPFYVVQKGWTAAIELRAGDMLVTCNGEYVVVEKIQHELLETPVSVYNFEVEDFHTYYVGSTSVLVHNSCNHNNAWTKERKGHWRDRCTTITQSNQMGADMGSYRATEANLARMKRGLAPIGWDGFSVELHHPLGIKNAFYYYEEVSRTLHYAIHVFLD